jgi:hypothetical protein
VLLHYLWVLRTDTAFEESAAAAGERRARAAQALRAGGGWRSYSRALRPEAGKRKRTAPAAFHLALVGRPETALVWKNLTFARRNFSRSTPAVVAGSAISLIAMFQGGGASPGEALKQVGSLALLFGGFLVVAGPLWVRNDLRMDLVGWTCPHLAADPGRLVAAEITASARAAASRPSPCSSGAVLIAGSGDLPLPRLLRPRLYPRTAVCRADRLGVTVSVRSR